MLTRCYKRRLPSRPSRKVKYNVTLSIPALNYNRARHFMSEHTFVTSQEPVREHFTSFTGDMMEQNETNPQLDLLRDRVLLLGGKTEEAVYRAVRSLTERDTDLARSVCHDDEQIDQMELEIDRLSIEILGSQRPTEHDLRLVVSVAKITPILERIADHASSIAEAAIILNN